MSAQAVRGEGERPELCDPALERALLRMLIERPEDWTDLLGWVTPALFSVGRARRIFEACHKLAAIGITPTLDMIGAELGDSAELDRQWVMGAPPVDEYGRALDIATVLHNAQRLRALVKLCQETTAEARRTRFAASQVDAIHDLVAQHISSAQPLLIPAGRARISATEQEHQEDDGEPWRVASGWPTFDEHWHWTAGLNILALKSGSGKTTMGLGAVFQMARLGYHAAFFSIEQSQEDIRAKRKAWFREAARRGITLTREEADRIGLYADPQAHVSRPVSLEEVEAAMASEQARAERAGSRVGLFVVDYLQHERLVVDGALNLYDRIKAISARLASAGSRLGVPVCGTSQFNRGADEHLREMPKRSHLLGGSSLVNDAVGIILGYTTSTTMDASDVKLKIEKQRWGRQGLVAEFRLVRGAYMAER